MRTVVETPEFLRRSASVGLNAEVRSELVTRVAIDARAGVALGGGLWKIRVARPGEGKEGGWRVVYFYRRDSLPIFMLTAFGKKREGQSLTR
ncbi:MAG: type II toxin-antitoxin system RelE/ParE family toxin [Oceanicaulis sp.]